MTKGVSRFGISGGRSPRLQRLPPGLSSRGLASMCTRGVCMSAFPPYKDSSLFLFNYLFKALSPIYSLILRSWDEVLGFNM